MVGVRVGGTSACSCTCLEGRFDSGIGGDGWPEDGGGWQWGPVLRGPSAAEPGSVLHRKGSWECLGGFPLRRECRWLADLRLLSCGDRRRPGASAHRLSGMSSLVRRLSRLSVRRLRRLFVRRRIRQSVRRLVSLSVRRRICQSLGHPMRCGPAPAAMRSSVPELQVYGNHPCTALVFLAQCI